MTLCSRAGLFILRRRPSEQWLLGCFVGGRGFQRGPAVSANDRIAGRCRPALIPATLQSRHAGQRPVATQGMLGVPWSTE
eukprot:15462889-Alexandrium_andersonii.AAC.1